MTKPSKSKQKQEPRVIADNNSVAVGKIEISGTVSGNIHIGNITNNFETLKTTYGLFTIPQPVTDFTGREEELTQLKASFEKGSIISGLSGSGGVGKTELARKLAHAIKEHFPDAQINIDLLGTSEKPTSPEDVMRRLLEPFYAGQKLPDDETQLKGLYQQTFASKKALLLLDNAANAAQVRPLIPPAPSAAIITSRQHFSLTEFGMHEPLRLDVLSPEKASELLRGASPKLNDASVEEVSELAKLCGHLPLALRVAASLLNDRPDWIVATLLHRLQDEHTRLKRLKREGDFDVEATLNLSYDLLDDDLKKHFRALGIFTVPFAKISAGAVLEIKDEDELDDVLGRLIVRSFLNTQKSHEIIMEEMCSLHDLTRLFAIQKLIEEQDYEEVLVRYSMHFLGWASEANKEYEKGNDHILLGLTHFRFILPHLYNAYERLLPNQKIFPRPHLADDWLIQLSARCHNTIDIHLSPRERINIFQNTLLAAQRLGNKEFEGSHLNTIGNAYFDIGDFHGAIEYYERALKIAIESGDHNKESAPIGNIGKAYAALGMKKESIKYIERALSIDRENGNAKDNFAYLNNLGTVYSDLSNTEKAIEYFKRALDTSREIGDTLAESTVLNNIGNIYYKLGNGKSVIEYHKTALDIIQLVEVGDRRLESTILGNIGIDYHSLGDSSRAVEYLEKALVVNVENNENSSTGNLLTNLGAAYGSIKNIPKAIESFQKALEIERKIGNHKGEGNALSNLGIAYKILGDKEKAKKAWEDAIKAFHIIEEIQEVAKLEKLLANLNVNQLEEKQDIGHKDFVRLVFQFVRSKDPRAEKLFNLVSKMKFDTNLSVEEQELAKVLWSVMVGIKNPDLSKLSDELAKFVKEELEK